MDADEVLLGNVWRPGETRHGSPRSTPLLADRMAEIRQAQRPRGRERPGVAFLAGLLISTLRLADDVGDALDARGIGDGDR